MDKSQETPISSGPSDEKQDSISNGEVKAALEAMLFMSGGTVTKQKMHRAFQDAGLKVPLSTINKELKAIQEDYTQPGRGMIMEEVAGGYRLVTPPELAFILLKFQEERRRQRLSEAAVETLAIVAYKQPITRKEISNIRGVEAGNIVRNLVDLGLVEVRGRSKEARGAYIYGTTELFLENFGLKSLEDLPEAEH